MGQTQSCATPLSRGTKQTDSAVEENVRVRKRETNVKQSWEPVKWVMFAGRLGMECLQV